MITQQQTEQLATWYKDPVAFINDCIFVSHPVHGSVELKLTDKQVNMINQIHHNKLILVSGKRQVGVSSTLTAYTLWCNLFSSTAKTMYTSQNFSYTSDTRYKMMGMYGELPTWLKNLVPISTNNKRHIQFDYRNDLLFGVTDGICGKEHSLSMIVVENAQYCRNLQEFLISTIPCIASNKQGKIILSSTSEGPVDCLFNDMVIDQIEGRNAWTLVEVY